MKILQKYLLQIYHTFYELIHNKFSYNLNISLYEY